MRFCSTLGYSLTSQCDAASTHVRLNGQCSPLRSCCCLTLVPFVSKFSLQGISASGPFFPHGGIPIPGLESRRSDSVEGIWQGLKVIRGKTAPRFFEGTGRKRYGKPRGHQYGDSTRLLSLEEARRKIYIPAYEWVLENRIDPDLINGFVSQAFQSVPQFFYDCEDNGSIGKDAPLAHAKILVDYINRKIDTLVKA